MDKIVHFEIPVDQIERAKKFYGQVFQWDISGVPGMSYHMVTTTPVSEDFRPKETGAINGGMFERDDTLRSPVLVVNVKEIKAAVDRIKGAGGTILKEPYQVGNMGIVAYFKDPEGNVLGVWQDLGK
jgi:predicted enzyme related to lactoylglutathione lyase